MAFLVGTASNFEDFFSSILRFLTGAASVTVPAYTGTGNGPIVNLDTFTTTVTENWTITCTAAATNGGTFSVVGSVSGSQPVATVGVPYSSGEIKFTINDGTTDFIVGDQFTFSTTSGTLPLAERWEVLRLRRDNIEQTLTNLNQPLDNEGDERRTYHTHRYDARSIQSDPESTDNATYESGGGFTAGVSFVQWKLREPKEIKSVDLRASLLSTAIDDMLKSWRLQYSDDGSGWTTALTITDDLVWTAGERRSFAVSGTPGVHYYWRILIDDIFQVSGSSVAWMEMVLKDGSGVPANHFGSEVILKAPGSAGLDEIYTGIRSEYNAGAGWYNLFLNGYSGYDPNELSWFKQPGALPGYGETTVLRSPMVPLWDTLTPYWFVASGRSFRFAAKVSTNFEGGYLGFIFPYSTPNQYPYPLAVGGSLVPSDGNSSRDSEWRYSFVSTAHGVFPAPGGIGTNSNEGYVATLYLRDNLGVWRSVSNRAHISDEADVDGMSQSLSYPFATSGALRAVWPHCVNDQWSTGKHPFREVLGGGYLLQPCIILQRSPSEAVWGELEGTFSISGFNNTAENTAVFNGTTHVVFQNAHRNTTHEFWALSLDS